MDTAESNNSTAGQAAPISEQVSAAILRALALAVETQELPSGLNLPSQITLERPKNRDHGDYATSVS